MAENSRETLSVGDVLYGRYRVDSIVHQKGMSNVYKVYDESVQKYLCLKEIIIGVEGTKAWIESQALIHETNLMRQLSNPSIPRINEIMNNPDSTKIWLLMDWISGESADKIIKRVGAIGEKTAKRWASNLADVLGYLHSVNIIYRDLKPANIIIDNPGKPNEHLYLIDFGISELKTDDNKYQRAPLGSQGYAAPEQVVPNAEYDVRWDIYAFGATLFTLITGLNPRKLGRNPVLDVHKYATGISPGLTNIILHCTEKNPDDRYSSIEEVKIDLQRIGRYDSEYRKNARLKLRTTKAVVIVGVVGLLATSALWLAGQNNIDGQISEQQSVAQSTGKFSDYYKLAQVDGTNLIAYRGMLKVVADSGEFTKDQEKDFLSVLTPNLKELQRLDGYGSLAYQIGSVYFFDYDSGDSLIGQQQAKSWMSEAIKYKTNDQKMATDLYTIADFNAGIQGALKTGNDAGMYANMWKSLVEASSTKQMNKYVEASLYKSLADTISSYSYRLAQEGVSKEDVLKQLTIITNYANAKDSSSDSTAVKNIKSEIRDSLSDINNKVDVAYSVRNS